MLFSAQVSKVFPLLLCASIATFTSVTTQAASMQFFVTEDNDGAVGQDRDYTNGTILGINLPLPALRGSRGDTFTLRGGQLMWVPSDIELAKPQANERPYAGLLFAEAGVQLYSPFNVAKFDLMVGTVGPKAGAEDTQKFIHDLIGSPEPMGWDYQIDNRSVYQISGQYEQLVMRQRGMLNMDTDLSVQVRGSLGTFREEAAIGTYWRWGQDLGSNFGAISMKQGRFFDHAAMLNSPRGFFLFAGLEGLYRTRDITIEGAKPDENADISIEPWQAGGILGGAWYGPNWGLTMSFAIQTAEFEQDKNGHHPLGTFSGFYRF
ncbi:hypothetical protein VST7929_01608 [Vibrio stylophorae]|uniref:DUF2219 domain-containing protein n=1 Tax=Vibrio stylophorae TaxID=659351 RepID=A0ABN8DTS0_9VIBR|nr:lipid A deacylase LpxR family protein [Vibrio stylophorae]CAH0533733.1 hypothetical protein VST7929_01608 [Vibrio stylophorae]